MIKDLNFNQSIRIIKERLGSYQPLRLKLDGTIPAAVLILFLDIDSRPFILFTRRTELVEHHKGQISFPGGARDPRDISLTETAQRETYEEIGIPKTQIKLIGESDEFRTNTNYLVRPLIGILFPPYSYSPNYREVDEILHIPLALFLDDINFEIKKWNFLNKEYDLYFYYYQNHTIWGVTAFLINRLVHIVFGYNPDSHSNSRLPK